MVQQWITEFEGENVDEATHFFSQITIDSETHNAESDWPEKIESDSHQFFISYGTLESLESSVTIERLAEKSLLHRVSKCDEITASIFFASYVFNAILKSRYGPTEFKKFFIDSKAATKSSEKLDQFEALQRLDNSIKIDHSTARSAKFTFGMRTTLSIKSIDFNTLIKLITFHIVIVSIFFFYV